MSAVGIPADVASFDPGFLLSGEGGSFGMGVVLHFPFDSMMNYIIDHGVDGDLRQGVKDRLRYMRQKVGPNLFQRYKLNVHALKLAVFCPACDRLNLTDIRVLQGQRVDFVGVVVVCECGEHVEVDGSNAKWMIDSNQGHDNFEL